MLKDIHYNALDEISSANCCASLSHSLGTIGNLAPFHSQRQKIDTTTSPQKSGANTTADVHGNVTPP